MNGVIYYFFHKITGMGYVGKHNKPNIYSRFNHHHWLKKNSPLNNALRFHGKSAFKLVCLGTGSSNEELNEKEKYWISELDTMWPNGYNMTSGGDGIPKGYKFGPRPEHCIIATIEANRVVTKEQVQTIRNSEKSVWELTKELDLSYQTIQRVRKRLTFKTEP